MWFKAVTGAAEALWLKQRHKHLALLPPVDGNGALGPHLAVGRWDAGAFRVWTLQELADAAEAVPSSGCRVEIHCRRSAASPIDAVEVSRLQAAVAPGERAMFQVCGCAFCVCDCWWSGGWWLPLPGRQQL